MFDLLVIGDGIAAKVLLFEFFNSKKLNAIKCQNFKIAQVYSSKLAPSCSLTSTATVSRNGVELGVSELGDILYQSFDSFQDFNKNFKPNGVEACKQIIWGSNGEQLDKLERRYGRLLSFETPLLKQKITGVSLESFIMSPSLLLKWFDNYLSQFDFFKVDLFLSSFTKNEMGIYECKLSDGTIIYAKKIVFCTGAYQQIFKNFFDELSLSPKTQTVSGSYMMASFNFYQSFFLTLDGFNLLYRTCDKSLLFGSSSFQGNIFLSNPQELHHIYETFKKNLNFPIPAFEHFRFYSGLRHKASKRMPLFRCLDQTKSLALINGLYKNGYSLPFYLSKLLLEEMFSP